ncbi:hypothetical protein KM043_014100 [Ampulex compressa]|nr:hypothetical protein KM043_014100 [Ampulex compressa]
MDTPRGGKDGWSSTRLLQLASLDVESRIPSCITRDNTRWPRKAAYYGHELGVLNPPKPRARDPEAGAFLLLKGKSEVMVLPPDGGSTHQRARARTAPPLRDGDPVDGRRRNRLINSWLLGKDKPRSTREILQTGAASRLGYLFVIPSVIRDTPDSSPSSLSPDDSTRNSISRYQYNTPRIDGSRPAVV